MNPTVTICGLLFGDHPKLHLRFLTGLHKSLAMAPDAVEVRLWLNEVCEPTKRWLCEKHPEWIFKDHPGNLGKYKAMRQMFYDRPLETDWIVWFDDDANLTPQWLAKARAFIRRKQAKDESVCYVGQPFYITYEPGEGEMIQTSPWYTGRPFQQFMDKKKQKPGVMFAQGSYWWLRTDIMRRLEWPDRRLNHNGGDILLGQALWQQNLPFHRFHDGVRPNDAKRRGYNEAPLGAKDKRFRR